MGEVGVLGMSTPPGPFAGGHKTRPYDFWGLARLYYNLIAQIFVIIIGYNKLDTLYGSLWLFILFLWAFCSYHQIFDYLFFDEDRLHLGKENKNFVIYFAFRSVCTIFVA